jgi:hypothetical protein
VRSRGGTDRTTRTASDVGQQQQHQEQQPQGHTASSSHVTMGHALGSARSPCRSAPRCEPSRTRDPLTGSKELQGSHSVTTQGAPGWDPATLASGGTAACGVAHPWPCPALQRSSETELDDAHDAHWVRRGKSFARLRLASPGWSGSRQWRVPCFPRAALEACCL